MSKSGFAQVGNINPSEITRLKLKVTDYVFYYQGVDLTDAYLEYYFDEIRHVEYEDGQRSKETISPIIFFSIKAYDEQIEYFFDFAEELSVEKLNLLENNKPTNINDYIIPEETYFQGNNIEFIDFPNPEDPYIFNPNFVVTKLQDNKFVFKIQCQNIFLWFVVDFKLQDKS